MNCHAIRQVLNDGDPRELSAAERRDIDRHLAACESCANAWYVHHELAARAIPKTPNDLLQRISRSVNESTARPEVESRFRSPLFVGGLLVLGAATAATAVWQLGKSADVSVDPSVLPVSASPQTTQLRLEAEPHEQPQVIDVASEQQSEAKKSAVSSAENYTLDANSVVVLPLENRTTTPEFSGLSDDVNEQILFQLGMISGLNVISGVSVVPYTESNAPAEEIARLFGAGNILVGSISETDVELILKVTLIDGHTGSTKFGMGSQSFRQRRTFDLSKIADRIAIGVAGAFTSERSVYPGRQQWTLNAQAKFLDTSLSDSERVQALGWLRYADDNARSGAVAAAAVEMAMKSDHARQIWEYLKGVGDPYLIQPLLESLAYDSSPDVRREAAKTLEDFIDEPGVREALEYAIAHDESQVVRDRAHFTLASEQERQAIITGIVLNTSLTDRERMAPLWEQRFANGDKLVLSDEAITALVDMAVSSDDPQTRGSVWYHLRGIDHPDLVRPLLNQLANDPNESVRVSAASLLGEYLDYSGVRSALEETTINETSRSVRRAARSSLGLIEQ